ncbi:helix-turn-helix transcriptional regulator [Enterococcus mundtii]|uniref:HTH-type transcriptional regulator YdeC n=1 Tax=Enterococcus mundtii TaxID=53346 RepID=A0ABQ0VIG3_ENTMU|nr:AraC family transcriptional regulator [Enterococcus mundtii]MZU11690.1 helix-turn-helix domain-containing protein [Bifidobacterium longum]GEN19490.1 putative HTH-type transcriptional regulator YdeC [Ligilactobacillus acidipiscis]AUB54055.1 AraC family transcriptional regulator [Enterococcus mundtii]MZZ59578.1 helix-turn-helix domain-containing protein [Enterococcus mundtii]MZZ62649.1 helix-turn-helix domain-containing protein [Enterococcus mundtii]
MFSPNDIFTPNPSQQDIDTTLKEMTEHGDSLFPIAVHYTNHPAHQENMIHPHWHRELEILYVYQGLMEVKIEGVPYVVHEGEVMFIPANQLHEALNHQMNACAFFAIVFDASFIESRVSDHIQQTYLDPLLHSPEQVAIHFTNDCSSISEIQQLVITIIDTFALKESRFELTIKAQLFLLIKHFSRYSTQVNPAKLVASKNKLNTYRCKKIILYLEENYQSTITLEAISRHIGYSKEHFCRFFKKHFRMTFFTYLNQMRIKKAEYLLLHTDLKIIDIALEAGFEDPNYFTSLFKRETQMTPTGYRKKMCDFTNI